MNCSGAMTTSNLGAANSFCFNAVQSIISFHSSIPTFDGLMASLSAKMHIDCGINEEAIIHIHSSAVRCYILGTGRNKTVDGMPGCPFSVFYLCILNCPLVSPHQALLSWQAPGL
jgi:hypothetical protein